MLGIDVTVSSTNVIMEHIQQEVPTHILTRLLTIQDKQIELVEVKIPADAKIVGKKIKDLSLPEGSMLLLIIRREQNPIKVTPDLVIQIGDQIIATVPVENEEKLKRSLKGD
jgi:trk system potassium uptake protein TrkA